MDADRLEKHTGSRLPGECTTGTTRPRKPGRKPVLWALPATLSVIAASWTAPPSLTAQTPHTENTLRLAPDASPPSATIDQFSFLQGEWTAQGLGGEVDELWSRPTSGTMVGAFRLIQDDQVAFYEIFALEEEENTVVLRLKHFNPGPGLPGWEERDQETTFRLVRVGSNEAWFGGLTYRLTDPDTLLVYLALRSSDGELREEAFHFSRVPR